MNKTLLLLMGLVLGAFLQACGPDEDVEPAKTVKKDLLYDKKWYWNGGWAHTFHSDGKYSVDGTWRWLNDSDSIEITEPAFPVIIYDFEYITETEMKMGDARSGYLIYTSTP
jgi:hypothetical protein